LDALTPKPEPEVWRWRHRTGFVPAEQFPTAAAVREEWTDPLGTPVRETVAPDGTITLTPEARDE